MEYYDNRFSPTEANDYDNEIKTAKSYDSGYNIIYRYITRVDGIKKRTKIEVYTSGNVGTRIRDAESGLYYSELVGSKEDNQFFKVQLSTGECKSKNGSRTLYYLSPMHYYSHLKIPHDHEIEKKWNLNKSK
jgi:hypothetical protein